MRRLKLAAVALLPIAAWALSAELPDGQRAVAAVFALTAALFLTELLPLGLSALLGSALLVVAAGLNEKAVFAAFGDPVIPLFIGSFLLARSMEVSGLNERIAWWVLSQPWASGSGPRLLFATGAVSCVVSLFVSNTATAAMLMPVVAHVVGTMHAERTRFATGMVLMLAWGSSVAVGFPVGTPPNLIGLGLIEQATGQRIGFVQWMGFAMPITAVALAMAWLLLHLRTRRHYPDTAGVLALARDAYAALPRMGDAQRNTLIAFGAALTLWVVPDLTVNAIHLLGLSTIPLAKWMQDRLTPTVAALTGAALLFVLPARDRPGGRALTWQEAMGIDWGVILLFGGGIALGQAMFSSGLAQSLGDAAARASGADGLWEITVLATLCAILLSEFASNTAAATTMVPVAIALAEGAGVSPVAPALGAALGASFGFMLPVSTPPNAIVYSSGHVSSAEMMSRGLALDIAGFVAILACLRLVLPVLGLA